MPTGARCGASPAARALDQAMVEDVRAPGIERAAARQVDQARRQPPDRGQAVAGVLAPDRGDRLQQPPGVGHVRLLEHREPVADLDRLAGVHHQDLVGDIGDHAEVVGDHDDRRPQLVLEARQQVQDLGLHGDVEGGGRFVGDQDGRVERERHGDHRPLLHTPGELVRVVVHPPLRPGDADQLEQLDRAVAGVLLGDLLVGQDHLADLPAHLVVRVQAESGSWKIIAIFLPRTSRSSFWWSFRRSRPRSWPTR